MLSAGSGYFIWQQRKDFNERLTNTDGDDNRPLTQAGEITMEQIRNPWPHVAPIGTMDPLGWDWAQRHGVDAVLLEAEELRLMKNYRERLQRRSEALPETLDSDIAALEQTVAEHRALLKYDKDYRIFEAIDYSFRFLAKPLRMGEFKILLRLYTGSEQTVRRSHLSSIDHRYLKQLNEITGRWTQDIPKD